jgi:hypothetical protein
MRGVKVFLFFFEGKQKLPQRKERTEEGKTLEFLDASIT